MTTVRPTRPQDASTLQRLAAAEPLFNAAEIACVGELLQDYLDRPDHNGYFFLTVEAEGEIAGFACYGPTPLTNGTYDLYWILVDREKAGRGLGRALMERVEREVAEQDGRLLVVETSGRPDYAPTRAFYESLGYQRTAAIPDFYAPGDDLIVYTTRPSAT
jgi:ribosomal protein S18 acetylase RimI-like enzyme